MAVRAGHEVSSQGGEDSTGGRSADGGDRAAVRTRGGEDLAGARTRGGEAIGALAARCTPADELDPETYERLLTILDRLP